MWRLLPPPQWNCSHAGLCFGLSSRREAAIPRRGCTSLRRNEYQPILKVLSVGLHHELLWLREAVLRDAGFDLLTPVDLKEGLAHIERGHCGVLLMCYSLPLP